MTKLPTITKKQETIISLIFRFRFLDRTQIQRFLKHKDYKTINVWLKDLTEKEYLSRSYSTTFPENTKPAVYHIAKNGIGFIKTDNGGDLKPVQKLYRENSRTTAFVNSCLLLANIYLDLLERSSDKVSFKLSVKCDYPTHPFATLLNDHSPSCFIEQTTAAKTKQYFLEVLGDLPMAIIRQRIKKYLSFYEGNEWEGVTGKPFPTVLLVCPDDRVLKYAGSYTKSKIALLDDPSLAVHLTVAEKASQSGITGDIWTKLF